MAHVDACTKKKEYHISFSVAEYGSRNCSCISEIYGGREGRREASFLIRDIKNRKPLFFIRDSDRLSWNVVTYVFFRKKSFISFFFDGGNVKMVIASMK